MSQHGDLEHAGIDVMAAIQRFRASLTNSQGEERSRLHALAVALDGLVRQYNVTIECEPDDDVDAPDVEPPFSHKELGALFPMLGYYASVEPSDDFDQQLLISDAIDDMVEIAHDLSDVVWYFENDRPQSAIWDFRFGYQTHWGAHLHDLRRHLHHLLN